MKKLRVVVVTHDNENDVAESLGSLVSQTGIDMDLFVVDSGSTDHTVDEVRSFFPRARILEMGHNIGFAGGCNQGLIQPLPEIVAFVNPDTWSDTEWLARAVADLDSNSKAGSIQPRIMLRDSRTKLNSRGNEANILFFGWPEGYGEECPDPGAVRRISFPSGCAVLFRREVLETTKGFDPVYFMYGEDLDLGIRSFLLGWDVLYSPRATIYHKYQYRESAFKFFLLERNRLLTMLKVYRVRTIVLMFPLLLASELAIIVKAIKEKWFGEKLRSYGSVLVHVGYLRRARKEVQSTRVRSDSELILLLKGAVKFEPLTKSSTIAIGNIILKKYRSYLLGMRL